MWRGRRKPLASSGRFPVRERRFQSKSGSSPNVPRLRSSDANVKKIKAKDVGNIKTVVRVRVMVRERGSNSTISRGGLLSAKIQSEGRTKNERRATAYRRPPSNRSDEPATDAPMPELGRQCSQGQGLHIRITCSTEYTEHRPLALT